MMNLFNFYIATFQTYRVLADITPCIRIVVTETIIIQSSLGIFVLLLPFMEIFFYIFYSFFQHGNECCSIKIMKTSNVFS